MTANQRCICILLNKFCSFLTTQQYEAAGLVLDDIDKIIKQEKRAKNKKARKAVKA